MPGAFIFFWLLFSLQIGPPEEARANPIVSRCGSLTMRDVTAAGALDSDFDESAGEEEWPLWRFRSEMRWISA